MASRPSAAQVARFRSRCQGAPGQGTTSPSGGVRVGPRGVGPDQRDHGTEQQQHAADGLGAQHVGQVPGLRPGRSGEQPDSADAALMAGCGGSLRGHLRGSRTAGIHSPTRLPGTPLSTLSGGAVGGDRLGRSDAIHPASDFSPSSPQPTGRLSGWSCGRTSRRGKYITPDISRMSRFNGFTSLETTLGVFVKFFAVTGPARGAPDGPAPPTAPRASALVGRAGHGHGGSRRLGVPDRHGHNPGTSPR